MVGFKGARIYLDLVSVGATINIMLALPGQKVCRLLKTLPGNRRLWMWLRC